MWQIILNWRCRVRKTREFKEEKRMKRKRVAEINKKYEGKFDYRIGKFIALPDKTIVMLDIPWDDDSANNVYALDGDGNIIWRSEDVKKIYSANATNLSYVHIAMKGRYIAAVDFSGRRCFINPDNGHIEKTDFVK